MSLDENQSVDDLSGSSRLGSIMDMDYEVEEAETDDSVDDENEESEDEKDTGKSQIASQSKTEKKSSKKVKEGSLEEEDSDDEEEDDDSDDEEESEDEENEEKGDEDKSKLKTEDGKIKIKYRVDGQDQEGDFTEKELASFISSHKASLRRMTELDKEKKQIASERENDKAEVEFVANEMRELKNAFSEVVDSFDKTGRINSNPVSTVYNLLDKMGLDPSKFERAVFFHHIPEVAKFLDMNEDGQRAYLLKAENEWHKKRQAALNDRVKEAAETKAKLESENSVKRQAGISEEEFVELRSELAGLGIKNPNTQQVIEWKSAKPFYVRAQGIADKVKGADADKIAKILMAYPDTSDQLILEKLGYKEIREREIKEKLGGKINKKKRIKDESFYEKEADSMFNSIFNRR